MQYNVIIGDLIELAKLGKFDVIAHGCNCFCRMKRGIAVEMTSEFGCDKFSFEVEDMVGEYRKLGNIQHNLHSEYKTKNNEFLYVVNCYTQYHWDSVSKPLDYEALTLCMRKINHIFKEKHIGLPQIGCGLAGGDWNRVEEIIKQELKDCKVTIVIYNKK